MAVRAAGRVSRIYPDDSGTYMMLADIGPDETPKDGLFHLKMSHPNYNTLYSLTLVAAVNRYVLNIRTREEITSSEYAEVGYMFVDW